MPFWLSPNSDPMTRRPPKHSSKNRSHYWCSVPGHLEYYEFCTVKGAIFHPRQYVAAPWLPYLQCHVKPPSQIKTTFPLYNQAKAYQKNMVKPPLLWDFISISALLIEIIFNETFVNNTVHWVDRLNIDDHVSLMTSTLECFATSKNCARRRTRTMIENVSLQLCLYIYVLVFVTSWSTQKWCWMMFMALAPFLHSTLMRGSLWCRVLSWTILFAVEELLL